MITFNKSQRGQALIIIAFAAVALFAFAALAIDGGMVFSDRRHSQNASDTAALAAALAKIRHPNDPNYYIKIGEERAKSNGYDPSDGITKVEIYSPPISGSYAGNKQYIQVIITSYVKTTFARVIGWQQVKNVTEAVARAIPGGPTPLFDGAALVALKQSGTGIGSNGNVLLDINGSGTFSNSTSNCSTGISGNGSYTVDTGFKIANPGTLCKTGNLNGDITNSAKIQAGTQVPYPPNIDIPTPSIACSGNGSVSGNTVHPGNFANSVNINSNGNVTFLPGNYCFNNGFTITGNANVTANDVNFRINGGNFSINGNSRFTNCSNVLVYGAGGSGMSFNGNGTNACIGITFFMQAGNVSWNGNVANTFTAPGAGDYAHVLIYMPYGNSSALTINGNSGNQLTGSIIAVSSDITIIGNSGTTGLHTQITGYTVTLNGNSNTTINYDAAEQYIQQDPASVELAN